MPRQNISFIFKGRQVSLHPDVAYAIRDICDCFLHPDIRSDDNDLEQYDALELVRLIRSSSRW